MINNYSTLDAKLANSLGYVEASQGGMVISFNRGCIYREKNQFITVIHDICFEKADRYVIFLSHSKKPIQAKIKERNDDTGITVFELPNEKCSSLKPLTEETITATEWGDEVYIAHTRRKIAEICLIPVKACPYYGRLLLEHLTDVHLPGAPIVNVTGNLLGLVKHTSRLHPLLNASDLKSIWTPSIDPVKRLLQMRKISSNNLSFADALLLEGVPCSYSLNYEEIHKSVRDLLFSPRE